MKKIDVFKSYEKVKVSLALEKQVLDLVDESLVGFKLVNMLGRESDNTIESLSLKNESAYKSILNRSEFISKILDTISDSKLFLINGEEYSLKQLSVLGDDIALASYFDTYTNITKFFRILNPHRLKEHKFQKMRNMNVEETLEYLKYGDEEIQNRILQIEEKDEFFRSIEEIGIRSEELELLDKFEFTLVDNDTYDQLRYLGFLSFGPERDDGIADIDFLREGIQFENADLLSELLHKRQIIESELKNQHSKKSTLKYKASKLEDIIYDHEKYLYSWKVNNILFDKLDEMIKTIVNYMENDLSDILKTKIIRNLFYQENNIEMINIFEMYLISKFNLDNNIRQRAILGDETLQF